MTNEGFADLSDIAAAFANGGVPPREADATLAAVLATESGQGDVARSWAAILWGALSDRGRAPANPEASRHAALALADAIQGEGDWVRALDALAVAHALFEDAEHSGARADALRALVALGPLAAPAIDPLVAVLTARNESDDLRALAAQALGSMAAAERGDARVGDPRVLDALVLGIDADNDPDGAVREAVLGALAEMGGHARAARPKLEAALAKPSNAFLAELIAETLAALSNG